MQITEHDKIKVLRVAKRDKIFTLKDSNDTNCGVVSFCVDEGLLENITPYTTRLTEKGEYYLIALDLKAERNDNIIVRKFRAMYRTFKNLTIGEWSIIVGIMSIIVAVIIAICQRQ